MLKLFFLLSHIDERLEDEAQGVTARSVAVLNLLLLLFYIKCCQFMKGFE